MGGTGITPAHQFVEHQLTNVSPDLGIPKLSIIYSSPTPSTILLQSSLDKFVEDHPGKLSLHYLVDKLDGKGTGEKEGKTIGRVGKKNLMKWIGDGNVVEGYRKLVIVCGSEGYVISLLRGSMPR